MFYFLLFLLQRMKQYFQEHVTILAESSLESPSDLQKTEEYKIYPNQFASMWDNLNLPQLYLGVPTMYVPSPEMEAEIARNNTCAINPQLTIIGKYHVQRIQYLYHCVVWRN